MSKRPQPLSTTDEVIGIIGSAEVRRITGASPRAVWNWKQAGRGRFPASTHMAISRKLQALGFEARADLWSGLNRIPPASSSQHSTAGA